MHGQLWEAVRADYEGHANASIEVVTSGSTNVAGRVRLADNIVHERGPALIIYENGKIPHMLRREGLPEDVVVMTSRYFLRLSQERGLLADAEATWTRIAEFDTRSNPQAEATLIQRSI
jgi:hypothetical protein